MAELSLRRLLPFPPTPSRLPPLKRLNQKQSEGRGSYSLVAAATQISGGQRECGRECEGGGDMNNETKGRVLSSQFCANGRKISFYDSSWTVNYKGKVTLSLEKIQR